MATRNWTDGAADGNLANSANYDTFPVSGDSLVFARGYTNITAGTTALSGFLLTEVIINEGFRASQFGTAGSPVKLETSKLKVSSNTLGLVSVASPVTLAAVEVEKLSGGSLYIGAGTADIPTIKLGRGPGYVEVASDVDITGSFRTAGMGAKLGPVASGASDFKYRIARGAVVESQRKMAIGVVNGRLNVTETGSISHTTSASTECIVTEDGTVNFAASGALQRIERLPGSTLSFEGAKSNVTIGEDIHYPGAVKVAPTGIAAAVTLDTPIGQGSTT